MGFSFTLRADGPADPAEVWDRYADTARWAEWSPQVRGVDVTDGGTHIRAGMSGTVRGPVGVSLHFVVTDVDATDRSWSWLVGRGPARIHLEHSVVGDGEGASTGLVLTGPAVLAPVATAYLPVARLALHRLVQR